MKMNFLLQNIDSEMTRISLLYNLFGYVTHYTSCITSVE